MTEEHVVISSLVVETTAQKTNEVAAHLAALDGVEVHGSEPGKIVVTIEKETTSESHDLANTFTSIEGVINVNLIYANFEDDPELQARYDALQEKVAEQAKERS